MTYFLKGIFDVPDDTFFTGSLTLLNSPEAKPTYHVGVPLEEMILFTKEFFSSLTEDSFSIELKFEKSQEESDVAIKYYDDLG